MPQSNRAFPALALAVSILPLAACERPAEPPAPAPAPAPAVAPTPPLPPPALSRAELVQALATAGAAYAAGAAPAGEDLAGRRFVVRQAFGCARSALGQGPGDEGVAQWSWNADKSAIRLQLKPLDWREAPAMAAGAEGWEAIEGFWLTWPWLAADGCPAPRADEPPKTPPPAEDGATAPSPAPPAPGRAPVLAPAPAPAPQVAGIAAVFERGGSRLGRREGRAYSFTIRDGDAPVVAPAAGYRLVLEGRLAAFPEGRAIRCHAASVDERPVCIAAAEIDRVAFEGADGKLLSEWRPG